jgi:hypothetical protein
LQILRQIICTHWEREAEFEYFTLISGVSAFAAAAAASICQSAHPLIPHFGVLKN